MLLVCTTGSMLPGDAHEQMRQRPAAVSHDCHAAVAGARAARKWMNIVNIHNKLRQGSASMADTWAMRTWVERYFAKGIGF
eukprot:6198987-Pleurochrysis_carterae.AAC.3